MLREERQVFYAPNILFLPFNCAYIFVYCLSTSSAEVGKYAKKFKTKVLHSHNLTKLISLYDYLI